MILGLFRGVTDVAIKQLHSGEDGEPMSAKAREEFIQEVKILKTLQHPNLVNIHNNHNIATCKPG